MKIRDSGMPDEAYWESLFDVPLVLRRLAIDHRLGDVVELGCGYGTFSVPVAQAISGTLRTCDIEPAMVDRTRQRAAHLPPGKLVAEVRDVFAHGFAGPVADAALLFNILHCDQPVRLLEHAARAVRPGGWVLATHWQPVPTPRGPDATIRPRPEQVVRWATEAGLTPEGEVATLPPWHWGVRLVREG